MAIETGDVIRTAIHWLINGTDEIVNVHPFYVNSLIGTPSDAEILDDIANTILGDFYYAVLAGMSDNIAGHIIDFFNLTKNETYSPLDNPLDGTGAAADTLSHQVTGLVCWNTGFPHRQGRCYLPPFTETGVDDNGFWTSGYLGSLTDFAEYALDVMTGDVCTVHRVVCHADGSSVLYPSAATVPTAPRTQRRRTIGRGS